MRTSRFFWHSFFNHKTFMRLSDTLGVYLHLFIASALKSFRSLMFFVQQTGLFPVRSYHTVCPDKAFFPVLLYSLDKML